MFHSSREPKAPAYMSDASRPRTNDSVRPLPGRIFSLRPSLKSVVWGGTDILHLKGLDFPEGTIGESWELSDIPGHRTVVVGGPDHGLTIAQLIEKYGEGLLGKRSVELFGMEMPLLVKINRRAPEPLRAGSSRRRPCPTRPRMPRQDRNVVRPEIRARGPDLRRT